MPFLDSLDIANRALQHCGVNPILSVTEDTTNNNEVSAVYDKVRRAELRRNAWRFAIRKTVIRPLTATTLEIVPAQYSASKMYLQGELVADTNNLIWISTAIDNLGNTPGGNNTAWDMFFGPLTVDAWAAPTTNSGQTYMAGELVYVNTGVTPNGYQVFMSLVNNNADTPNTAQAWSATVQYQQDQVVSFSGSNWRSLLPINLNNSPAAPASAWVAATTYTVGAIVAGSDNYKYTALGTTTGNDPTTDGGVHWAFSGNLNAWASVPTLFTQDTQWRYLTCGLKNAMPLWPVGSGPVQQTATKNVYRLPAGYVGPAPQNPKQGLMAWLGGPSGNNQPDWEYDGNFVITTWSTPIIFRFVADITKVSVMDDMFCEGLACRIAQMICKRVTGSGELTGQIAQAYKLFMGEARLKNGIENGTQEIFEDEYVTVRI
jgi:hypothetical protein